MFSLERKRLKLRLKTENTKFVERQIKMTCYSSKKWNPSVWKLFISEKRDLNH